MSNTPVTLTLEIGKQDTDSYPLRLLVASANEIEVKAETVIDKQQFDNAAFGVDPVQRFNEETGQSANFETIGEHLYSLLHRGRVGDCWDEFIDANDHLRVQLDIRPAELAALPWELISDGLGRLAINPLQTFIRRYQPAKPLRALVDDRGPLRVLLVVGAKLEDNDVLADKEIRRIESEIRKSDRQQEDNYLIHRIVDIEILRRPDLTKLESAYKDFKPHIFHFIGHGGLDKKRPYLVINYFDPASNQYRPIKWATTEIYNSFIGWKWLPRFVLINACRSENREQTYQEVRKQAWSIGDVFRRLGVPAVLTMQADINGESAGVFAGAVYKSLAELDPLDTAVANARRAIVNHVGTLDKREWAIPVLTIAQAPEEILPLRPRIPREIMAKVRDCQTFKEIELFADRIKERRKLIRGFYPLPPETAYKEVIIIQGDQEMGKSWLATWCMEACALQNHDIRYVEVGGRGSKTWLDVLLQIRDGDPTKRNSSLIHDPLKESAFYRFNWEIRYRYDGVEPPNVWDGTIVAGKPLGVADPQAKWTPTFIEDTLKSFCKAIVQAAEINHPLIIVLDHLTKSGGILLNDMKKYLLPELIGQAVRGNLREEDAAGGLRSVKFILVLTKAEFKDFELENLLSGYLEVPLIPLNPKEFMELFEEYVRQIDIYSEEELQTVLKGIGTMVEKAPHWTPKDLLRFPF